jgi:hypothetical protein
MMQLYFMIFWIPAIASAVMLLAASQSGLMVLSPRLVIWFGVALLLQIVGQRFSPAWTVGLVVQAILALYLAIKLKLG